MLRRLWVASSRNLARISLFIRKVVIVFSPMNAVDTNDGAGIISGGSVNLVLCLLRNSICSLLLPMSISALALACESQLLRYAAAGTHLSRDRLIWVYLKLFLSNQGQYLRCMSIYCCPFPVSIYLCHRLYLFL